MSTHSLHRLIIATLALVAGCSETGQTELRLDGPTAAAGAPAEAGEAQAFSCASLAPENPGKAALADPRLLFDVDVPQGFEIHKKTENELAVGYLIGARAVPGKSTVTFGYELDQKKPTCTAEVTRAMTIFISSLRPSAP